MSSNTPTNAAPPGVSIRVEGIGKRYILGKARNDSSVRDGFNDLLSLPLNLLKGQHNAQADRPDDFWALRDVSFDLREGEVLGIVGSNGSGKSTLLKILSRITRPTAGHFEIFGRLGSLLEIGTGFHPDLTGRENVYLNGSFLGMKRHEIEAQFDRIVEFSGVEKFIDTQVKYFSSGMYVRLAFSVAAHLGSDILLLDEVLAVGDIGFQQKSREKTRSIAKDGRSIIFVSHIMPTVLELCDRVMWLNKGHVMCIGDTESVVKTYMESESAEPILDQPTP